MISLPICEASHLSATFYAFLSGLRIRWKLNLYGMEIIHSLLSLYHVAQYRTKLC